MDGSPAAATTTTHVATWHDALVTRIGIIGGGKGATLHADAIIHTRGADLVGVGGGLAAQVSSLLLPTARTCRSTTFATAPTH